MKVRDLAKSAALRLGVLGALQRRRNSDCLTVTMFHRVLPEQELAQRNADPEYTLTTPLFSEVIGFLRRFFTIVSLDDVLASQSRTRPLPARALLITFDDGWRDNMEHASPILRSWGVPWTLFAAADAVAEPACWWQEALLWGLRTGKASHDELMERAARAGGVPNSSNQDRTLALLSCFASLAPTDRQALLMPYCKEMALRSPNAQMLSFADLRTLHESGVAIGAHGASHLPLAGNPYAAADLARARNVLASEIGPSASATMSFPHGRYDRPAVDAARQAGYRMMFTSDPVLNDSRGGWIGGDLLGRIPIAACHIATSAGRLVPGRLATWLFLRERSVLDAGANP